MRSPLRLETFTLGEWQTNCYVIHPGAGGGTASEPQPCWIVDAGFQPEPMIDFIRGRSLRPERVVLTHAHLDHIAGLAAIRVAWPELPILIHEAERDFLTDPLLNMSALADPDEPITAPPATATLRHGQSLELAGRRFEVRHTPGHSPGGISLYQPDAAFVVVGDTLFAGSVGRTDFPTSDSEALLRGLREQLLSLPDETAVYPGHGPATTIGAERATNRYLRGITTPIRVSTP